MKKSSSPKPVSFFWFRRDLRLVDNAALYHALKSGSKIIPLFIFDSLILDELEDKDDPRLTFIYDALEALKKSLKKEGSDLLVKIGKPEPVWAALLKEYTIKEVFANEDYEPYALERDKKIGELLKNQNASLRLFKDQCIFSKQEVIKDDGDPYTVFTPYKRKWLSLLKPFHYKAYPTGKYLDQFESFHALAMPSLDETGFKRSNQKIPDIDYKGILKEYKDERDFPAKYATSRIGIHLRFGTVSIRELVANSLEKSDTWLNELIWRDFYFQILFHFPHVVRGAFKPAYDHIKWRNNEAEFKAWCEGKTGYPLVDAGMRQLNETGFMHNRLRMLTASFLAKDLLIDWHWGEAYFARKLLDFELSSNNGGWQWAAGTGCDAAPYFRIFSPSEQQKKFDADLKFIKEWVPDFQEFSYPKPIVDHAVARTRCLDAYKKALDTEK